MAPKLFIKTYGCQMNEYDTAKIADLLAASHGLSLTDEVSSAQLIILNTCSVRAKAEEKLFSELGRLRNLKKSNPKLVLAVGGCVSMQEQTKIFKRAPYVDIVFGPQTLHRLPNLYEQALHQGHHLIDVTTPPIEKFDYFPKPQFTAPSAYVSIMEGCNKFCSYCIVPFTRGREISRPSADILREVNQLVHQGAKEIHLLGQNVNAYYDSAQNLAFPQLLKKLADLKEVLRIRFTTSHPKEFSAELITLFQNEPKLASQIHLPIQSGSNHILAQMRRGYNYEEYQEIIAQIRQARPTVSISTDFIVGFPGESEADFLLTLQAAQELNFDAAFSFIYSPRPHTAAAKLPDKIPSSEKKARLCQLQTQLAAQNRAYNQKLLGTWQQVLITATAPKNPTELSGRTDNNRVVNFTAPQHQIGTLAQVKITEVLANSLRGTVTAA